MSGMLKLSFAHDADVLMNAIWYNKYDLIAVVRRRDFVDFYRVCLF